MHFDDKVCNLNILWIILPLRLNCIQRCLWHSTFPLSWFGALCKIQHIQQCKHNIHSSCRTSNKDTHTDYTLAFMLLLWFQYTCSIHIAKSCANRNKKKHRACIDVHNTTYATIVNYLPHTKSTSHPHFFHSQHTVTSHTKKHALHCIVALATTTLSAACFSAVCSSTVQTVLLRGSI